MIVYISSIATLICTLSFFWSIQYGIYFAFLTRPIIDASWSFSWGPVSLLKVISVVVPVAVLIGVMRSSVRLGSIPLIRLWLLYLAFGALSATMPVFLREAGGTDVIVAVFDQSFRLLNGFAGYLMVQVFITDREKLRKLLIFLMLAGIFPMAMGVYQAATGVTWHDEQTSGLVRYGGLYHSIVNFRMYAFQTIVALLLYWKMFLEGTRSGKNIQKIFMLVLGIACLLVLYRTYSKAAVVILGIWVVIWSLYGSRAFLVGLIFVPLALIGFVLEGDIAGEYQQLFSKEIGTYEGTIADDRVTLGGRWFIWERLLTIYAESPAFVQMFGSGNPRAAHNDFIGRLMAGGIVGLVTYTALIGATGLLIWKRYRQEKTPLTVMGLMVYLMWLVDSMGLLPSHYPGYQWFAWGFMGLALRGLKLEAPKQPAKIRAPLHPSLA